MTKRSFVIAASLVLAAEVLVASVDDRLDKLSDAHREWLEEEVVYIVSERERDVFLSLESIEERERLITAFWAKRDPNRATPINEFKEEHYRRLRHANEFLGRESFREGWRTDRGRYYIIVGQPREIQRFDGYKQLVSTELWFYQGESGLGIPSFFYLLFFKKDDLGEYRIYDPIVDGPQALLRGGDHLPGTENARAVAALREISHELAVASLSFDTSEPPDLVEGRPAMGTSIMLARIEDSPKRAVRTEYANAYLAYGNRVGAEYSFNFVPSRNTFSILLDEDDIPWLHYSIEIDPENLTLETNEARQNFYTTLDLTLEIRSPEGRLVSADEKQVYLELSPSQMEQVRLFPFAYQDDYPLVPGDYKVAVVLRNRAVKQFTVAEADVSVPDFGPGVSIPDVVLGFSRTGGVKFPAGGMLTYQIGPTRVQPAADNLFVIGETVFILTQAHGASLGDKVAFDLLEGEEALLSTETTVGDRYVVLHDMKLDGLNGGKYELRTRVVNSTGDVTAEKRTPITISPLSAATRPSLVYRFGFDAESPGVLDLALGEQLWNLGRYEDARVEFERAVAENPDLQPARWKLANAYLRAHQPDHALELLIPLEHAFPTHFDVVAGLGFAHYLKETYDRAVEYLTKARQIRPPDTVLLNALADSHQRLGNRDAAREAFEQSLELDPSQEAVKNRLAALTRSGA